MNKNKVKRRFNIFGWTKASHKGAILYFTDKKKWKRKPKKEKELGETEGK